MQSLSAMREALIWAPSLRASASWYMESSLRSLPARSTIDSEPSMAAGGVGARARARAPRPRVGVAAAAAEAEAEAEAEAAAVETWTRITACEREDCAFTLVAELRRDSKATRTVAWISSEVATGRRDAPETATRPSPSSRNATSARPLSRSNTLSPQSSNALISMVIFPPASAAMAPRSCAARWMRLVKVCVLPEPVWPYMQHVTLPASITRGITGRSASSYT
mmetsp:Transcript_18238/g.58246  ORF Transcript_18238/g.58246 Transcript_18238/m.58246 type:complete len:224 (+) Transcript_18238:333-1004(+)